MKLHQLYPDVKWVNQSKRDFTFYGYPGAQVDIGNDVALNDALIDITGCINIGDNVHFGHRVMILTTSHPPDKMFGLERRKELICKPIVIEKDAYIGSGAMIMPGVTIGQSAYIAAGAIVTKDVPSFELWGGNPAKKIR